MPAGDAAPEARLRLAFHPPGIYIFPILCTGYSTLLCRILPTAAHTPYCLHDIPLFFTALFRQPYTFPTGCTISRSSLLPLPTAAHTPYWLHDIPLFFAALFRQPHAFCTAYGLFSLFSIPLIGNDTLPVQSRVILLSRAAFCR